MAANEESWRLHACERPAPDPLYVAARRVLLDGLEALGQQRQAAILVGAHAVYCGWAKATWPPLPTPPTRTSPSTQRSSLLNEALRAAGFWPKTGRGGPVVGSWVTGQLVDEKTVNIDLELVVPEAVSGGGAPSARLGVQGDRLARRAFGLELALVDSDSWSSARWTQIPGASRSPSPAARPAHQRCIRWRSDSMIRDATTTSPRIRSTCCASCAAKTSTPLRASCGEPGRGTGGA